MAASKKRCENFAHTRNASLVSSTNVVPASLLIYYNHEGYAETVPGEGIVLFRDYVLALCKIGCAGHLVVKREAGDRGIEDAIKAREFLEKIVG